MKRVLITFSGAPYENTTRQIVENAVRFGATDVWVYDDKWLMTTEFYRRNPWLWDHPHKRGFGWYAWKPFIILNAITRLDPGDVVIYTDADCVPIQSLNPLFERCAQDGGIMLFASENHRQFHWCKRDCYVVMGQDDPKYYDVQAGVARFMLFQNGYWLTTQFLLEWLTYCLNPLATTFDPSVLKPELEGFVEHRAEQAIMTNLAHRYGLNLYREACEAGNSTQRDREIYGQLFTQINPYETKETFAAEGSLFANVGDSLK